MLFHNKPFFGLTENPLTDSPFVEEFSGSGTPPPPAGNDFLLLDGTNFLLLENTNFLLL